ncbi:MULTISPECIES: DUF397 domain-containing protein [Streptomyces]|uniref:DUF397 domain-containing protein n=1 Tax=Streptomyces TaxID=1883 RepID=UPI00188513F8|nr:MULTISPECIES: DUF397 domain-containing protein [Streptomyces]MBF8174743.1 DUF397 domain-containing protein [Streptomyces olivaceus]MBZ6134260.1 DUF397 domain-containing protein [Streptomyces olivaceus]MBZ6139415.1 DUF397 domain-containing protein [Streptomyces olivaceus]MBZ6167172.1 DUF397 domain-containing protein [Streptomyces olivaceus]MBZ6173763.1 DUF397 domain-containing protein [Streptomyces olivaceus]
MTEVVSPFWKSSYSGQENNCVEIADTAPGGRAVRDSKQQDGPLLTVSREGWQGFLHQFS